MEWKRVYVRLSSLTGAICSVRSLVVTPFSEKIANCEQEGCQMLLVFK
jgi:hypothetical protein